MFFFFVFFYPKFDSFFQFALIIWKEMPMASNGLGPWFHKKIVDPLIQILRRYSQKIVFALFLFVFCLWVWVIGCNWIEIWWDLIGFVLNYSLMSVFNCYYAFPMLRFWWFVCQTSFEFWIETAQRSEKP